MMRFTKKDPFPGIPWISATTNRYTYALNNPVLTSDPSGWLPAPALDSTNRTVPLVMLRSQANPTTTLVSAMQGPREDLLSLPPAVLRAPTDDERIQARFQELIQQDSLLRQSSNSNFQLIRKQELREQARMEILGPKYTPPLNVIGSEADVFIFFLFSSQSLLGLLAALL
jgi:hypothetical protein